MAEPEVKEKIPTSSAGAESGADNPAGPAASTLPRIKIKRPSQRACDELDAKGKVCCGHLKRWYDYPAEVAAIIGPNAEIYRCEFCKTLYKPDPAEMPHSYTLRY